MKRNTFFLFGMIISIILGVVVFSYFWYVIGFTRGEGGSQRGMEGGIVLVVFTIAQLIASIALKKSYYKTGKQSIFATILYFISIAVLVLVWIFSPTEKGFDLGMLITYLVLVVGLFVNYAISIFVKE